MCSGTPRAAAPSRNSFQNPAIRSRLRRRLMALRRAMSRRRSRDLMAGFWNEFRDGAAARGVPEHIAERVCTQGIAFSEFGFPKSHAAAFGLLAYEPAV